MYHAALKSWEEGLGVKLDIHVPTCTCTYVYIYTYMYICTPSTCIVLLLIGVDRIFSVAFKTKLACIETWKCHAPTALEGAGSYGSKKFITIRKLGSINYCKNYM